MNEREEYEAAKAHLKSIEQEQEVLDSKMYEARSAMKEAFRKTLMTEKLMAKVNWQLHFYETGAHGLINYELCSDSADDPECQKLEDLICDGWHHYSYELYGTDGRLRADDGVVTIIFHKLENLLKFAKDYGIKFGTDRIQAQENVFKAKLEALEKLKALVTNESI